MKYGPNERKIKTPKKELSDKEIANLSDAEFKTLVVKMLTEMVEYGSKIKEVKAIQSEIKIYREPTVKGRKLGFKSITWNIRKESLFKQNKKKKQEFKTLRRV